MPPVTHAYSTFCTTESSTNLDDLLAWAATLNPITQYYCQQIESHSFKDVKIACSLHIVINFVPILLALHKAEADISLVACNNNSTDNRIAQYLHEQGIKVYGWRGMEESLRQHYLKQIVSAEPDYICDMGGELIAAAAIHGSANIKGALEATQSGLNLITPLQKNLAFPVFDWNSIRLKNCLENRFHVGEQVWPIFNLVTHMTLINRKVLVIGYGPVGRGVAERARDLRAQVMVHDLDPVRVLEAQYHGCMTPALDKALSEADIIVTATGHRHVLSAEHLLKVKPGCFLLNVGHFNHEIDIEWLYQHPYSSPKAHIDRIDLGSTYCYLLAKGDLLNLAVSDVPLAIDLFDPYTSVIARGLSWLIQTPVQSTYANSIHPYPYFLEEEIARRIAGL